MNYDLLENVIPRRSLPDDHSAPRAKLHDMLRALEALREDRRRITALSTMNIEGNGGDGSGNKQLAELDRKIGYYERLLE